MEQKIVLRTEEKVIYYMQDNNLNFYFIIPNNKKINIVLGLFPDVTENFITALSFEKDKAILIPVINNQILTSANHLDTTSFKYVDSVLSYLINTAYKILTNNRLLVDSKILLNNNTSYENFNTKYIEKYQGRVELYSLLNQTNSMPPSNTPIFSVASTEEEIKKSSFTPVEPPFKSINNTNEDSIEEEIEPILYDEPVIASSELEGKKEPGFVSYVLLGVLIAVILLVFLYVIL